MLGRGGAQRLALVVAVVGLLLVISAPLAGQRGPMTLPRNLSQLVHQADVIIHGGVLSARVEPHPELASSLP